MFGHSKLHVVLLRPKRWPSSRRRIVLVKNPTRPTRRPSRLMSLTPPRLPSSRGMTCRTFPQKLSPYLVPSTKASIPTRLTFRVQFLEWYHQLCCCCCCCCCCSQMKWKRLIFMLSSFIQNPALPQCVILGLRRWRSCARTRPLSSSVQWRQQRCR